MAQEYCKVLLSKGIQPQVFSRDLVSANVQSFQKAFPALEVQRISDIGGDVANWLVCTNIASHEAVCSRLQGKVYCEKPYSHHADYDTAKDISILMNRRYYYWVSEIQEIINSGKVQKVVAIIPERSVDALITQSIHVIDLLWYLLGPFQAATRLGASLPTYLVPTERQVPLVINMNYGAHENFSVRFYADKGIVYEARPLEMFAVAEGMEVREPDEDIPVRTYRPIVTPREYIATGQKPGLSELVEDLLRGAASRLPGLPEHRQVHAWMQDNML